MKQSKEKRYKVIYERDECVGAGACVVASPKNWQIDNKGKAILQDAKAKNEIFELDIAKKDLNAMLKAAKSCPVKCIHFNKNFEYSSKKREKLLVR